MMREWMAGDVSKLPKWAQAKIAHLERTVQELQDQITELCSEHPGTNVTLDRISREEYTLPNDSQIRFYLEDPKPDNPRFLREYICVRHAHGVHGGTKENELYISSSFRQLLIQPVAGNAIRLWVSE